LSGLSFPSARAALRRALCPARALLSSPLSPVDCQFGLPNGEARAVGDRAREPDGGRPSVVREQIDHSIGFDGRGSVAGFWLLEPLSCPKGTDGLRLSWKEDPDSGPTPHPMRCAFMPMWLRRGLSPEDDSESWGGCHSLKVKFDTYRSPAKPGSMVVVKQVAPPAAPRFNDRANHEGRLSFMSERRWTRGTSAHCPVAEGRPLSANLFPKFNKIVALLLVPCLQSCYWPGPVEGPQVGETEGVGRYATWLAGFEFFTS